MAMEIFKLVGSIMVDSDKANESLQKTDKKAEGVGKTLAKGVGTAAKWTAGLVAGAGVVAAGMVKVASNTAETADGIDKASQRMKISAESYQELAHAASLCGVEMSTMEQAAKKLEGTDLNFDDAMNQIYSLATEEERAAKAAELFGEKVAYNMTPMLNASGDEMAAMKQEARDLGLVMSNDMVKDGAKLNDSLSKVKDSFGALATNLGGALMPIVQDVCDMVISYMPQIQSLFQKLAPVFQKVLSALLPPLAQLVSSILPIIISLIETLLPPVSEIIESIMPIIVQLLQTLLPPLIQIVQALLPVLLQIIQALLPILQPLLALLQPIIDILVALIVPIANLISAYLPPLISLWTKLASVWLGVVKKALEALKPVFDKLGSAINGFANIVRSVVDNVKNKFTSMKSTITNIFNGIKSTTTSVWNAVKSAITTPIENAKTKIKGIVDTIKGFFSGMKISIPHIKLPHFSITPKGWSFSDLLKGTIPKLGISWYAKGGILDQATPLNMAVGGEAGKEAVIPLEKNTKGIELIANKLSENMTGQRNTVLEGKLDKMIGLLETLTDMNITLDSKVLVGQLAPAMDTALGDIAYGRSRGR